MYANVPFWKIASPSAFPGQSSFVAIPYSSAFVILIGIVIGMHRSKDLKTYKLCWSFDHGLCTMELP